MFGAAGAEQLVRVTPSQVCDGGYVEADKIFFDPAPQVAHGLQLGVKTRDGFLVFHGKAPGLCPYVLGE
jgi:hypothetical protein